MTTTMLERGPELSVKQPERKESVLDAIQKTLDTAVQDDPVNGVYRVSRDIFTDPEIFELEIMHIFEGNWIYLAHESQIPNKNDYFTTYMGRQPIFIARNRDGELNTFINACSHRGAMLCRFKRGNKATYTCPFHGWTFNNSGKLLKVKDPDGAEYPRPLQQRGLARSDKSSAVRILPRVSVWQPEPRCADTRRASRRNHQDHRHDRRPSARGSRGAARRLDLCL